MGPLAGLKVIEIAGMGPAPFAAMLLADLGAEVIRLDRWTPNASLPDNETRIRSNDPTAYVMHRGRRSIGIDLKSAPGREIVLELCEKADVLLEGYRPGVMERLGLGPQECMERNSRLVYGRMTGWGQEGPLSQTAGHDINYIAMSGALHSCAREGERPVPPVNFLGDFGGGGLMLALGVVSACWEADRTGSGQIVDAAIVDGSASLTTMLYGLMAQGRWKDLPGTNFIDTGAPYYDVYETLDHKFIAVGAIEPRFYQELLAGLALLDDPTVQDQDNQEAWPAMKKRFADVIKTRTRDAWEEQFRGTDACVSPVLNLEEAVAHPANRERQVFTSVAGITQPAPAPRFSRTVPQVTLRPPRPGEHTLEALRDWGVPPLLIETGVRTQAVGPLG